MSDDIIEKILNSDFLTLREKEILKMRLKEGLTFQEIGKRFGITRERVRQIGEKIKRKMVTNLNREELKEYIREAKSYSRNQLKAF